MLRHVITYREEVAESGAMMPCGMHVWNFGVGTVQIQLMSQVFLHWWRPPPLLVQHSGGMVTRCHHLFTCTTASIRTRRGPAAECHLHGRMSTLVMCEFDVDGERHALCVCYDACAGKACTLKIVIVTFVAAADLAMARASNSLLFGIFQQYGTPRYGHLSNNVKHMYYTCVWMGICFCFCVLALLFMIV